MSTTKNSRIRKLIARNLAKKPMSFDTKLPPNMTRQQYNTMVIDNNEARKTEIERLERALGTKMFPKDAPRYYDSPAKKPRMRKFGHKKQKTTESQPSKKGGKR